LSPDDSLQLLTACGLPQAWRGRRQWRVLSTEFGQGQRFFQAWAAWQADPERPGLLHWCALLADPLALVRLPLAGHPHPDLVKALQPHVQDLLPGFHRISLERGRVLLTLCVDDGPRAWQQLCLTADSLLLEAPWQPTPEQQADGDAWRIHILKALARSSRRGTRFAVRPGNSLGLDPPLAARLRQCGFTVQTPIDAPLCSGSFDPPWEPKRSPSPYRGSHPLDDRPGQTAVVIGAGLAGAAVAHSLARRGWQVAVLDAAAQPAMGASGLPAGLVVPHVSPDDSILSQLSRAGLRITRQHLQDLLTPGTDWATSGVMEHRTDAQANGPGSDAHHTPAGQAWSQQACAAQLRAAGLPDDTAAWWHPSAAWVKPAALVRALLNHPGIAWHGQTQVQRLHRTDPGWTLDAQRQGTPTTYQADLVVLAAANHTQALLADLPTHRRLPLQPVRGQATWAREKGAPRPGTRPPFPVNGHGSLISQVPDEAGAFWILGSTFERDQPLAHTSEAELRERHLANLSKLHTLLPAAAAELAPAIHHPTCQAFVGIRCASPDRLPLVGPLDDGGTPGSPLGGLCVSTAMGSRGLTFALLCAELLAAQLHGEPWPLEKRLAQALDIHRGA